MSEATPESAVESVSSSGAPTQAQSSLPIPPMSLDELLAAPRLPSNVPPFDIIEECVAAGDPGKAGLQVDLPSGGADASFLSSKSTSSLIDELEADEAGSEVEEVFPCECRADANEKSTDRQACGQFAGCINRDLFIECSPQDCHCSDACQNQRFQKHQYANVKVVETKGKGFGLFTCEDLRPGTLVMEYVGEVLTKRQMDKRSEQYAQEKQHHFYFMTRRPNQIIDATKKGNLSRFMNHSCAPNCETQKWIVNGRVRIGLFSTRPVKAGSELTFDYKFVRFGTEPQRCLCGEPNCTGFIGVSKDVDEPVSAEFEIADIVSEFLEETSVVESPDDVSRLTKYLLRTDDSAQRLELLRLLSSIPKSSSQLCLRKFLSLHGLRILSALLGEQQKDIDSAALILDILAGLPVQTANAIEEANLPERIERLSDQPELAEKIKALRLQWESLEKVFRIPKKPKQQNEPKPEDCAPASGSSDAADATTQSGGLMASVPSMFSTALQQRKRTRASPGDSDDSPAGYTQDADEFSLPDVDDQHERAHSSLQDRPRPAQLKRQKQILDPDWRTADAPDGRKYYYHHITRETRWDAPMVSVEVDSESAEKESSPTRNQHRLREDSDSYHRSRDRRQDQNRKNFNDYRRSDSSRYSTTRDEGSWKDATGGRSHALVEGVEDSSQVAAIIERAKARRSAASPGSSAPIGKTPAIEPSFDLNFESPIIADAAALLAKESGRKTEHVRTAPRDGASMNDRKMADEVAALVVKFLSHYKSALGDKFKETAKKYTHRVLSKEAIDNAAAAPELSIRKKAKIKAFLAESLQSHGIELIPEHRALLKQTDRST